MDFFNIIQRFEFFYLKLIFLVFIHFYEYTTTFIHSLLNTFFKYSDSINILVHVPVYQSSSKVYTKRSDFLDCINMHCQQK